MIEIFIYASITGSLVVLFIVLLALAIFQQKQKLFLPAFIALFAMMVSGGIMAYKLINKAYTQYTAIKTPRSGMAIYNAVLGESDRCVAILHYQDQVVPRLDDAIRLHFSLCPEEARRLLSEYDYTSEVMGTTISSRAKSTLDWWQPLAMGDSIWKLDHEIEAGRNSRTIYMNLDSTEMYCEDRLD